MKKIAMIQNGTVVSIAVWDGVAEWNPPGFELVDVTDIDCNVGDIYKDGVFTSQSGS